MPVKTNKVVYLSKILFNCLNLDQGKCNYFPNRGCPREQHHHPINTDAKSTTWGHPILNGTDKKFIMRHGFLVSSRSRSCLLLNQSTLNFGIVKLRVRITEFHAGGVAFKSLDEFVAIW